MVAAIPAAVTLGVTWKAMSGHREEGEGGTEQSTARPGEGGEVATDTAPRGGTISGHTEETGRQLMGTVIHNSRACTGMRCVVTHSCHSDQCCPLWVTLFSQLLVTATLVAPPVGENKVK